MNESPREIKTSGAVALFSAFPSECGIRNDVLVTVKQLPVEAAGCTLTHVEQHGESEGIRERQRGSGAGPAADQLKVRLKEERREDEEGVWRPILQ